MMSFRTSVSVNLLRDNPEEALKFVGKKVSVETTAKYPVKGNFNKKREQGSVPGDNRLEGFVKTIDPVSGSVVLLTFDEEDSSQPKMSKVSVIVGKSIKSLMIIGLNETIATMVANLLEREEGIQLTGEQILEMKEKFKDWISKNQIPFEEKSNGTLLILPQTPAPVALNPPYEKQDFVCSNDTVLGRIRSIIEAMPK